MFITQSLSAAIGLITSLDRDMVSAVTTSVGVSVVAIIIAAVIAIPAGVFIGMRDFPLKRVVITILNTLMALPTVVIGLVVYGLLSRQGLFGSFGLLFTPTAMIIGQTVLAVPVVANYTLASVHGADPRIVPTALTLGASPAGTLLRLAAEVRFGIMAAVIAGFGRVISEVGIAMMLGGNIQGYTRTMTTAIALETSKGEFAFGLALGIVLMAVALATNLFLNILQQR